MSTDAKMRDMEGLSACLDELAAAETPLQRRAEILASLRERFDAIVSSQLSPAHAAVIVPALCEASGSRHPLVCWFPVKCRSISYPLLTLADVELYSPSFGSRGGGACEQAEKYSY